MRQDDNVEDDGFITAYSTPTRHPLEERCADCQRWIAPNGSGHLSWCPFDGDTDFPRLFTRTRHPVTNIAE